VKRREFPASRDRGHIDGHTWSPDLTAKVASCPRESEHRYGPDGYLAWHEWAEERMDTHVQLMCDCGLYLLLVTKAKAEKSAS
jgi:hypothetical protein